MSVISLYTINGVNPLPLETLREDLEQSFRTRVRIKPVTVDMWPLYDPARDQYYSTGLLEILSGMRGHDEEKVAGITDVDLFIPILTFVFGEAQLNGTVAVLSTCRLHNEPYGLPPDRKKLSRRILKELLHEIGHTRGLIHCADPNCPMHLSTSVDEVDIKFERYCPACRPIFTQHTIGVSQ